MASTSSLASQWNYDVFISFRGADVRDGFLSHLFHALCQNQIVTFKDENLERGEEISPALLQVIEESHVAVVILSENYGNSPWCLDELVKIVDCKERTGQIVVPIFYHVDPTDVQELTWSFGEEFEGKMESWRNALRETAKLAGFDSQNVKPESKLISEIVRHILKRVNHALPYVLNDDGFIGIDLRVNDIESKLCLESNDVRFLGIWGMGGIGKTTVANKIFCKISSQFESTCFVLNVREKAEIYKLDYLRREIFSELFGTEVSYTGRSFLSCSLQNMLMRKKVLIVLDDVSEMEQIEFLIGKHDIYRPGSRIIMTSRDKQVLKIGGVDEIYEVKGLSYCDALQLLSLHAFKQNYPIKGYTELAGKVVQYAKGIPLALKVLGSTLHDKNIEEWEDELEKLESMPDRKIQNVLRLSYDELDYMEKEIFLDIACFLKGEDKNVAESILSCLNARIGISRLLDKALVTISWNKLDMHDLLQQMGRDIVREEFMEEPSRRSRLWIPQDVYNVLTKDLGEISTKCISLDISKVEDMKLSSTAFQGMKRLRLLKIYNPYYPDATDYHSFNEVIKVQDRRYLYWYRRSIDFLPDELRYLYWYRYPSKSLPLKFCPNNLVQLHLIHSLIEQLCNKNSCFASLMLMDFSYSVKLIKIADLSRFPRLEVLCLRGCTSLLEIRSARQYDNKLQHVNLANCKNLCNFSSFLNMKNLEFLSLEDCSRIREFPEIPRSITCLILNRTAIKHVPSSIMHYSQLAQLELRSCRRLQSLPSNIGELKSLEHLDLGACSKLMNLPDSICNLKSLKYLLVDNCLNLKELPENLGNLEALETLCATKSGIKKLPSSINLLGKLKSLRCDECRHLILPPFTGLPSLNSLSLENCGLSEISESLGFLKSLSTLILSGNNLEMLPVAIKQLSKLEYLLVSDNKRLKYIPELPSNLQTLSAENCTGLQSIMASTAANLGFLWWLDVRNCINLDPGTLRKIMDDVLLKVENRFPQLVQDLDKYYHQYEIYVSCLQSGFLLCGGELPERMKYKNENGSNIMVSMGEYDPYNFMVVTFCAVVSSTDYKAITGVGCKSCLVAESGTSFDLDSEWQGGRFPEPNSRNKKVFTPSKHIYFWVSAVYMKCKQRFTAASFRFLPPHGRRGISKGVVKKCGVHLMFCNKAEIDRSSFERLNFVQPPIRHSLVQML